MKKTLIATTLAAISASSALMADPADMPLVIEGEEMISTVKAPDYIGGLDTVYSGWLFRAEETQALEIDDFENPGMPAVDTGIELWNTAEGSEGKSCASCHGDISDMAGVRTTMPKINEDGKLWSMEEYINNCRTERMGAEAWKRTKSAPMLAMNAAISLQSRGMPMNVAIDGEAAPYWEIGEQLYYTRVGQLDMSCASCHEDNYGVHIRADHLSQGQINGFPTYRLKWGSLGSIHRRFKGCMKNIRATPYKPGGEEFMALELYVASRGNGLSVEAPSVRN
ncbi:MAG TPA: sulfur oxidation c-type cytochrome SoxA [Aliiroseovarius sp.]|nr:sulfur oxidation c-type cytochrome SoxA [Aliiroseovarius sp.]